MWLSIFSRPAIGAIWIWKSTARLKFVGAIYFNDMEKLRSLNSHLGYKILWCHSPEEFCIALAIGLLLKVEHCVRNAIQRLNSHQTPHTSLSRVTYSVYCEHFWGYNGITLCWLRPVSNLFTQLPTTCSKTQHNLEEMVSFTKPPIDVMELFSWITRIGLWMMKPCFKGWTGTYQWVSARKM